MAAKQKPNYKKVSDAIASARRTIAIMEAQGYEITDATRRMANQEVKRSYSAQETKSIQSKLNPSSLKSRIKYEQPKVEQPVLFSFEAISPEATKFKYMRDAAGNIMTYKSGAKRIQGFSVEGVRKVKHKFDITEDNAYDQIKKVVDFSLGKHPSDEAASDLVTLLNNLEKLSGVELLRSDLTEKSIVLKAYKMFPDKETFDKAFNKALEESKWQAENAYRSYIKKIATTRGLNERGYAAYRAKVFKKQKNSLQENYIHVNTNTLEKIITWFETSKAYSQYRNKLYNTSTHKYESDGIINALAAMFDILDDPYVDQEEDKEYDIGEVNEDEFFKRLDAELTSTTGGLADAINKTLEAYNITRRV